MHSVYMYLFPIYCLFIQSFPDQEHHRLTVWWGYSSRSQSVNILGVLRQPQWQKPEQGHISRNSTRMPTNLPSPQSPKLQPAVETTRFQYRSTIGVGLNKNREVNPLKMFTSSPVHTRTESTRSRKNPPMNTSSIESLADDLIAGDQDERWDGVDLLFNQLEEIQRTLDMKLKHMNEIHEDMTGMLLQSEDLLSDVPHSRAYLPTPDDEEFTDGYLRQHYIHQHDKDGRYVDIPSSPESYTSQTSQLEIEINEQITRMAQRDPHNRDIMKLRNVATSMLGLMRYEVHDEDGILKLINLNDEVHIRSERMISSFDKLLDSFSS